MKILLPTDFSITANNAFKYAVAFAQAQQASIVAFHCYYPKINPADVLSTPGMDQYIVKAHEKMETLVSSFDHSGVSISPKVVVGFIVDEIIQRAESLAIDLIIMGNTGHGHGVAPLFGSVSSETALRAPCPVLLIPAQHNYHAPRVIALASSQYTLQEKYLSRVVKIAQQLKARLDFVHIEESSSSESDQDLKSNLPKELQHARFTNFSIDNNSLIDGLNQYAQQNNTDWLVMVPREKSFWQKIFSASKTNEMIGKSLQPLLVVHNRDIKTEIR